jgi:hypothetical protein
MIIEILNIILDSAEEAFLAVGVFVAAVLLIIGFLNYKQSGKLVNALQKAKRIQPIFGALLGLTPGCGGAIFVMPLYLKGKVSFGTVIAALVATMGDSAFLLISSNPDKFLIVSSISFGAAIITGYIIDLLGIDGGFSKKREKRLDELKMDSKEHEKLHHHEVAHVAHENGDEADVLFHHSEEKKRGWIYRFTHGQFYIIFWAFALVGFILGLLMLFQVDVNNDLFIKNIGKYIGIGGTFMCLVYIIVNRKVIKKDELEEEEHKLDSLKETFIHDAVDVAFVTTWVFIGYLVFNLLVFAVGGENVIALWMMSAGIMTVIMGALIGLIPGSGPQIIFVALYGKGLVPFAALLANAISQDGDALFPLLAIDRKSSLTASLITTIPAIIIGVVWFLLS